MVMERVEEAKENGRKSEYERTIDKAQVIADRLQKDHGVVAQGFIGQLVMQTRSKTEVARQILGVYKQLEKTLETPVSRLKKVKIDDSYGLRKRVHK